MKSESVIETKDILTWCFTVGALDFGVFGFLFSTYAAASFQADPMNPSRPLITHYLKRFCQATVVVLAVLTVVAAVTLYQEGTGIATWRDVALWCIMGCFLVLLAFSVGMVWTMD